MGDKPSVEAQNFHSDVDDPNFASSGGIQDVSSSAVDAGVTHNPSSGHCSANADDAAVVTETAVVVNGVRRTSRSTPFSYSGLPPTDQKRVMKQSKSASHNVNGETSLAMLRQDGKRSLSLETEPTVTVTGSPPCASDQHDNCGTVDHQSEAVAELTVVPPSPSTSSTVTVVSAVHADDDADKQRKSGLQAIQAFISAPLIYGHILCADTNVSKGKELSVSAGHLQLAASSPSPVPRHSSEILAPKDRSKHTLGDVLVEIESRSASLLQTTNYATPASVADLQFLAYQSRYSTDLNIKRRIITKLVDSGLIDVIVHVLASINDAEGFQMSFETLAADSASLTGSIEVDAEVDLHDGMKNLRSVITLAWNATDKSSTLCEQCVRRGVISMLLQLLENPQLAASELQDKARLFVVKGCLGILGAIVRACDDDATHEVYRSAGAVKALQQFLRCSLLAVRTKSLIILSYITTESENDVIHATDKNLTFAVKMLQSAIESDSHYSNKYGYWAIEIVSGVNRLAGFELNKERLYAAGLLSQCFQLLDPSCSDDEILVATQTFWILSFSSVVRAAITENCAEYVTVLRQLSTNHVREEIKRTAASVLWMFEHSASLPTSSPTDVASAAAVRRESDAVNNRVLVISHHTSGQTVLKIRGQLRSAGYRVHIDPDMRSGTSGIETLVENVDRSAIVLVFLSNRLKNSAACRSEVEYALSSDKTVIAVRIHRAYVLDGWLNASFAGHSVLNFYDGDDFEAGIIQLLQRVGVVMGPVANSDTGGSEGRLAASHQCMAASHPGSIDTPLTTAAAASTDVGPEPGADILSWTSHDVQKWLHHNDLDLLSNRFRKVTGELLVEMRRMQKSAPESFYTSLRTDLELDFITMMKFTRAMSRLEESTD